MEDITSITILLRGGPTTWHMAQLTPDNCGLEAFQAVAAHLELPEPKAEATNRAHCLDCGARISRGKRCTMHAIAARTRSAQRVLTSCDDYVKLRISEGSA